MDSEQRSGLRYIAEMAVAAALEVGVVLARKPFLATHHDGSVLRDIVLILPVFPIWLMLVAVIRHYLRIDEYQRLKLLQIVSLCAGIAVCIYTSYPFVADVFRLKPLDIAYAWPIMAVCWIAATLLSKLDSRIRTA